VLGNPSCREAVAWSSAGDFGKWRPRLNPGGLRPRLNPGGDLFLVLEARQWSPAVESGGGAPKVESGGGVPKVESGGGVPKVESGGGVPKVESGGGVPRVESGGGVPTVEFGGGVLDILVMTSDIMLADYFQQTTISYTSASVQFAGVFLKLVCPFKSYILTSLYDMKSDARLKRYFKLYNISCLLAVLYKCEKRSQD
jgi:hypothetical protein